MTGSGTGSGSGRCPIRSWPWARHRVRPGVGELVLHLGDFRTGTTTIQGWLRAEGATCGIHYPPGFNHAALAQSLADDLAAGEHFKSLAANLALATAPHAVISAEHFEMADPARLAAALDRHLPDLAPRARLVAYVRPHPAAFLARFSESAKIGNFTGSLEDYLDWPQTRRRMSYAPRFAAWRAVFGDRFTLRLYDRAQFPGGDVLRDFRAFVTGTDPGVGTASPAARANPSPGLEALALARALHAAIGPLPEAARGARWTLGRHLGRQLAAEGRPQTPLRLHRSMARRLVEAFAADAAATDAAFFQDRPLATALATAEAEALAAPQSLDPADHLAPEALRIVALWGGMLRDGLAAPGGAELLDRLYHE